LRILLARTGCSGGRRRDLWQTSSPAPGNGWNADAGKQAEGIITYAHWWPTGDRIRIVESTSNRALNGNAGSVQLSVIISCCASPLDGNAG
jgi:hypothetical protein